MKKVLECSTKGDKRFSAFYAKVKVFGFEDSIEGHYQSCKRNKDGYVAGKSKKVELMVIPTNTGKSFTLEPRFLTAYYKLLWCAYLDSRPDLVEIASAYDDFNDMFRGKAINCQADVIKQYVKQGRKSILNEPDVKEFRKIVGI